MTSPTPTLTDERIDAIAVREYKAGGLPWLGFKKDADGRYTVPLVTESERALIRACVAEVSNEGAPAAAPERPCGLHYIGGLHSTWGCDACGHKGIHDGHPGCQRSRAASPSVEGVESEAELAKEQPCGCVICTCEDEEQCHGCGAKHCGEHAVGRFSNPFFQALDKALAVPASPLPQG